MIQQNPGMAPRAVFPRPALLVLFGVESVTCATRRGHLTKKCDVLTHGAVLHCSMPASILCTAKSCSEPLASALTWLILSG